MKTQGPNNLLRKRSDAERTMANPEASRWYSDPNALTWFTNTSDYDWWRHSAGSLLWYPAPFSPSKVSPSSFSASLCMHLREDAKLAIGSELCVISSNVPRTSKQTLGRIKELSKAVRILLSNHPLSCGLLSVKHWWPATIQTNKSRQVYTGLKIRQRASKKAT
jgi:hypothetical protein